MTNRPMETPIGKPVRIGECGYQLYSETWPDGNTTFYAKVGHYYEKKETGEVYIIPKLRRNKASDHRRAGDDAEKNLDIIERSQQAISQQEKDSPVKLELVGETAKADARNEAA